MTEKNVSAMKLEMQDGKPVLLQMNDIEKSFPGVKALDKVSLTVKAGTVHALMGENGAGKSTLMKCLFGVYSKDSGKIFLEGNEVNFKNSKEALEHGVAMVHQELNQALKRNVMDNMWLGRFPTVAKGVPITSEKKMYKATKEIFDKLEIDANPKMVMSKMPVSQRQMVEIAKAVSYNSKIIVFDEPTSSLTENEVEHLFRIINMLRDQGCGIIYISHKMKEILRISDEVTIMRDGKWIATKDAKDLTTDEIIRLMVGRELTDIYDKRQLPIGDVKLSVEHLSSGRALQDISFEVHRGEIFGFLGLVGAGRSETAETIFGLREKTGGKISIDGKVLRIHHPADAIRHNMAFITEDRRQYGLSLIHSVRQNCVISSIRRYCHSPLHIVSEKQEQDATARMIQALGIKTPTQETLVNNLSGGNQQKIVVAKWLLNDPDLLIMDEPTRGIDVGAKSEIYSIMSDMAADGKAVIMISSEMPELLGMCDRIMVMCEGRNMGIFDRNEFDQVKLMAAATGTKKEDIRL